MFSFWSSPPTPKAGTAAVEKRTYVAYEEQQSSAGPAHSTSQQPHPQHDAVPNVASAPATTEMNESQQPASKTTTTTQRHDDEMTFEEAHRQTCVRLQTLHASLSQVAFSFPDFRVPVPNRQAVVVWGGTDASGTSKGMDSSVGDAGGSSAAFSFLAKNAKSLGWKESPDAATFSRTWTLSSSSESSTPSLLASAGKTLMSRLSFGGGEGSSSAGKVRDAKGATPFRVQSHDLIVCESLVVDCLRHLMRTIQASPTTDVNHSHAWVLHGSDEYSFRHWLAAASTPPTNDAIRSIASFPRQDVQALLAALPSSDVLWLLRLLEYGQVVRLKRGGPDEPAMVVMAASADEASVEHSVATLRLLQTRSRLDQEATKAEDRAAVLQRQALQQRQSNPSSKAAIATYRRSKIYKERAVQCHQNLVTVEQSLSLLELSVTNQDVLRAIQTANSVLTVQRVDLGALDDVLDDMADHVEHEQQVRDTIKNSNNSTLPLDALDDDDLLQELMQELQAVTINDESKPASPEPSRTDAPTPPSVPAVQPKPNVENEMDCANVKPAPTPAS